MLTSVILNDLRPITYAIRARRRDGEDGGVNVSFPVLRSSAVDIDIAGSDVTVHSAINAHFSCI